jgi:hypothetical protein
VDILAALSPVPIILAACYVLPDPYRTTTRTWLQGNWGNVASVWGLAISVYVMWLAKGARAAAEEATAEAEKAAAEARASAQARTVLEDLQEAAEKTTQIGLLAESEQWTLVKLRADEVRIACRTTLARWGEEPVLKESRNALLKVANMMETITQEVEQPSIDPLNISEARLNASNKLSFVLGKARREQDLGR